MAIATEIVIDEAQLNGLLAQLKGVKTSAAKLMVGAINDTLKAGKSQLARDVVSRINIKSKSFKKRIKVERASIATMFGKLRLKEYAPPNIASYGAIPKQPEKKNRRGLSYKVFKGGPRIRVKDAFMAKARHGAIIAFRREGKARYPINPVYSPSINEIIKQQKIDEYTLSFMREKLPDRIRGRLFVALKSEGLV